jgi:hypothetical protein
MKKTINGLRYDTDNATALGIGTANCPASDFHYWEATLYRTPRSGRYFIAGKGGAMSRFAQSCGQNSWGGGSDLIPMSEEDAREWAEEHLTVEEVEAAFAAVIEDA